MRKVYLDELPRYRGSSKIDWVCSIGFKVKFQYDTIEGELEIIDYDKKTQFVKIRYNNIIRSLNITSFARCKISVIIGLRLRGYKYEIGETVLFKNGTIKVLDRRRVVDCKHPCNVYTCICFKCNDISDITQERLYSKASCRVCCGNQVKIGFNDMWTTHPNMAKLLKNPEDGYKYTYSSKTKLDWVCLECEQVILARKIKEVHRSGICCPRCNDGFSYPNKFIYNMLSQLREHYNILFSTEVTFVWSKQITHENKILSGTKRYDFYIEQANVIIEVHGMQHYEDRSSFNYLGGKTLFQENENDEIKQKLAILNGISKYITINASRSNCDYIKQNVLDSELSQLYDLNNINWLLCHKFACGNIIKQTCNIWNSGIHNTSKIADILNIDRSTVLKYLKKGNIVDWVDNLKRSTLRNVVQLTKSGEFIREYDSAHEASVLDGFTAASIYAVCRGKLKTSGGYRWMYLEEYNKDQLT